VDWKSIGANNIVDDRSFCLSVRQDLLCNVDHARHKRPGRQLLELMILPESSHLQENGMNQTRYYSYKILDVYMHCNSCAAVLEHSYASSSISERMYSLRPIPHFSTLTSTHLPSIPNLSRISSTSCSEQ